MKKIGYIRELFGSMLLPFKSKKIERSTRVHNLSSAQKIGVIFDASDQDTHKAVVQFVDTLIHTHNIKVDTLAFIQKRELLTAFQDQTGFHYFSKKDFNMFGIAKSHYIINFITTKYDIVIDLSLEDAYPFNYITALSHAEYIVGRFTEEQKNHDLMIDIRKDTQIDFFLSQILIYLSMIQVSKKKS
ncbi:MAG: hypothetical protein PF481_06020 [Bacteroidales bacterium]|jgi:hypothetical protein|nr:hypothetical protein [Bacteroidales bacterium]